MKQAELALSTASLEVKKQWGAYLPVLFAEAGYVKQKRAFPVDEYGYGALRFSVPLFRGGETTARVAAARERETQARLALEELRREVTEEVHVALLAVEAARARVKLADERLTAAQADYDQTFEQYRNQLLTTLDVQSAETSLAEARRGRIAARLGLFLAEVRTFHAAGDPRPRHPQGDRPMSPRPIAPPYWRPFPSSSSWPPAARRPRRPRRRRPPHPPPSPTT